MSKKLKKMYVSVHLSIFEEYFDQATGMLSTLPILGIEEGYDLLTVTFLSTDYNDEMNDKILEIIRTISKDASIIKTETIEEKNWNEEFEKETRAIRVTERIGIAPEWKIDVLDTEIKIIINPKMSFGTGEHATTRLVGQYLESLVRPGSRWIDAGCGTGALAILAIKLGASSVFAFDNDDWCIENSKENFEMNGVTEQCRLSKEDVTNMDVPPSDGICANLFFHLLQGSMDSFFASLKEVKGDLVVSGILTYDVDELIKTAIRSGFSHISTKLEQDWAAVHFRAEGGESE